MEHTKDPKPKGMPEEMCELAGLVLEHLDAPTPESAAELRTVATHGRRR